MQKPPAGPPGWCFSSIIATTNQGITVSLSKERKNDRERRRHKKEEEEGKAEEAGKKEGRRKESRKKRETEKERKGLRTSFFLLIIYS